MSSLVDQMKAEYGVGSTFSSSQPKEIGSDLFDNLGYRSSTSRAHPEYGEITYADKLAFAARMGFGDTFRGVKQLLGVDEEDMAEDMSRLNSYLQDEEIGGSIMAAYTAGLFGDPVGWFLPGMKAKNVASAVKMGAVAGGITGATGYVDEENGMNRITNTMIGIGGGSALSPAMYKFNKTILPSLKTGYGNTLKAIDEGELNENLNLLQKGIAKPFGMGYKGVKTLGNVAKGSEGTLRNRVYNNFGNYFVDNFGLPELYKAAKGDKRLMSNKWAGDFNDVLEKFAKLKPEEDRALYRLMTNEKISKADEALLTPEIRALGKEGRAVVNKLGKELVRLGILEKDTFVRNRNKYLYRSYEKHEGPKAKKKIVRDEATQGVIASEFARRGRDKKFYKRKTETLADAIARGEKEGYRLISRHKGHALMNRDWTAKERKDMGEIISSTFALAKTGKLMSNDVALFKFYDDVSKMGSDVVALNKANAPEGFKMIPEDFVFVGGEKTRIKKFGALSGKWVSPEVYRDITWADKIKRYNQDDVMGIATLHRKMLQYWKRTKTSLNPVVHMNNVMSNFVLYDLVDANYKHLGSAGKDFWRAFHPNKGKRVKSDDFREAEKLGVFNADIMKRELADFEHDTFKRYMKIGAQNDDKLLENLWEGTKKYAGKTHMDRLYSAEDSVFRLGLFKDKKTKLIAEGVNPEEAAKEAAKFARKYMLDYEIDAPAVQLMRESFMPFISYTYRAAPIIGETLVQRPWKIAKWGAILVGANQLVADDEEYRTERKRQKELNMGFNVLGIPGANTLIKVPRGDKSQYLDVSRWIPAGDVLQVKDQGFNIPGVPAPFQPSAGAAGGIFKAVTGFDTFTKQQVPGVGSDSMRDELSARIGWNPESILGKEFIPYWNQGWNIWNSYVSEGKRHPTKDDRTLPEALLGGVGIKVKTYDEKKMATRVHYKYQNKIESLTKKIRKMVANKAGGRIQSDSYDKEINRLRSELKKISKEAQEALRKSK